MEKGNAYMPLIHVEECNTLVLTEMNGYLMRTPLSDAPDKMIKEGLPSGKNK